MTHREFTPLHPDNEFIVREVKLPDLEEVKVITKDPYGGMDYTNNAVKQWLEDSRWHLFCVETSTCQIIGFTALNVTDGEKSVVVRSSRIAHAFRGKGIYKALLNYALAEAKKKFPRLENIFRQRMVDVRIPVGYTCLKPITEITLQCDTEKAASMHTQRNPETSHFQETRVSFKDLANRYKTDEAQRSLYPLNLLTIEGEVFDITEESNVDYLQSRKEILVFFSKGLSANNDEKVAVSILNLEPKQTDEGVPCANFDVQSNDAVMAAHHLQRALYLVASGMRNEKFNLNVLFNYQHEKDITEFVEKELLCCNILAVFKMQLLRGSFSEET